MNKRYEAECVCGHIVVKYTRKKTKWIRCPACGNKAWVNPTKNRGEKKND